MINLNMHYIKGPFLGWRVYIKRSKKQNFLTKKAFWIGFSFLWRIYSMIAFSHSICFIIICLREIIKIGQLSSLSIKVCYSLLLYKYSTTLHRSSFDVINILAIFSHEISLEKPHWQRGDLNLRRRLSVNSLAIH